MGLQKQTRVDNFFAGIEIVNDISTVERATTNHSLQIEETFQADTHVKKGLCREQDERNGHGGGGT